MSSRQAVIETGSFSVKAGLWEQTFIPTVRIPSFCKVNCDDTKVWGKDALNVDGDIKYPLVHGTIVDFTLLEELWKHILINELGLMEPLSDVMLLLVLPPSCGLDAQSECLRICFEKLGVACVYLGEAPVLAALGCAQANGIVVDFGHFGTDVSVVWDGHLVKSSVEIYPVGGQNVDQIILDKLQEDLMNADIGMVKALKNTGKVQDGQLVYQYKGESLTWSRVHIFDEASNIYFNSKEEDLFGLHHLIMSVLYRLDADKRPSLLDSIIVTGLASQLPSISSHLTDYLTSILPASDYCAEHQTNKVTIRHVPEYYPEVWQAAGPVAAWFGAGITAKMVFPDSKAHYTREEYTQLGGLQLLAQKPL